MAGGELRKVNYRTLKNEAEKQTEDAMLLLLEMKEWERKDYLLRAEEEADPEFVGAYRANVEKLIRHVPLQKILHRAWFFGYSFYVDEHVLTPRFDTEILAEEALSFSREKPGMSVLDLCTGSGCIAVVLAKEGNFSSVSASDISKEALLIAERNAAFHEAQVSFFKSDLFGSLNGCYDLIVSNPPYIERDVIGKLSAEVRDHDPYEALCGGEDGLDFYRRIAHDAKMHLKPDGRLFLEIGFQQREPVEAILKEENYREIRCIKDLNHLDRVITCLTA